MTESQLRAAAIVAALRALVAERAAQEKETA